MKFLESTADTTLCYPINKFRCVRLIKLITIEIKNLERWSLFADDFCKHFYWTFFLEPRWIITKIKIFNSADRGIEKGLHNNISSTLIIFFIMTELSKIKVF